MKANDLTDILAECLEAIERGERTLEDCLARHPEQREELAALLNTVTNVRQRSGYAPRPNFRLSSRARLLRRLPPRTAPTPRAGRKPHTTTFRRWLPLWTTLTLLLVSLLGVGTAYASGAALPGDALFPVKLSIEDTRLLFANDADDVALAVGFALTRVEEIQALVRMNRTEDLSLAATLFADQIASASSALEAVAQTDPVLAAQLGLELEQNLSVHTERLNQLLETVPEAAKPAIEHALQASSKGKGAVHDLIKDNSLGGPPDELPGPAQNAPGSGPPNDNDGDGKPDHAGPPDGKGPPQDRP